MKDVFVDKRANDIISGDGNAVHAALAGEGPGPELGAKPPATPLEKSPPADIPEPEKANDEMTQARVNEPGD